MTSLKRLVPRCSPHELEARWYTSTMLEDTSSVALVTPMQRAATIPGKRGICKGLNLAIRKNLPHNIYNAMCLPRTLHLLDFRHWCPIPKGSEEDMSGGIRRKYMG